MVLSFLISKILRRNMQHKLGVFWSIMWHLLVTMFTVSYENITNQNREKAVNTAKECRLKNSQGNTESKKVGNIVQLVKSHSENISKISKNMKISNIRKSTKYSKLAGVSRHKIVNFTTYSKAETKQYRY